jgi:hypothetical protein
MPEVCVVHVGVGEETRLRPEFHEELRQIFLREDGNPVGIQLSGEGGWVVPPLDPGNLRGGECDDSIGGIVTKADVEIVEIAASGSEDDDFAGLRHESGSRREC